MELNIKTFKNLKVGDILVKSPCHKDKREYIVKKITDKFICCKCGNKNIRINTKYYTGPKYYVTEWNIKDEEWQKEWDEYWNGCGTEAWYYAHGGW